MILAYRQSERVVFLYGFAKNDRPNIDDAELERWRSIGRRYIDASDDRIETAIDEDELTEVDYDEAEDKKKVELKGKARMRAEIVDAFRGLNRLGMVSDDELEQTTLRMLGRDALPKVKVMSPAEIAAVRERAGVSQAVMAGYLNVGTVTVSQWERGIRRPTGTALKLLHFVRQHGLDLLR